MPDEMSNIRGAHAIHVASFRSAVDPSPVDNKPLSEQQLDRLFSTSCGRSITKELDARTGMLAVPKIKLEGFVPVRLKDGGKRSFDDVLGVSLLVFDIDNKVRTSSGGFLTVDIFKRCVLREHPVKTPKAWIYTTVSHTEAHPKFRAVFPLKAEADPSVWPAVVDWAVPHLGLTQVSSAIDMVTRNCAQLWFLPTDVVGDPPASFDRIGTEFLDPPLDRFLAHKKSKEDDSDDSGYDRSLEELVKSKLDVAQVAQKYGLEFRRDGRYNLKAFCPFHKDRGNPNFKLDLRNGKFKCFACQWRGDIIDFVRAHTKENHRTTLEVLALQAGVDIEGFHAKILQFPKMPGITTPWSSEDNSETDAPAAEIATSGSGVQSSSAGPASAVQDATPGPAVSSPPPSAPPPPAGSGVDPSEFGISTAGALSEFAKSDHSLATRFSDIFRPTLRFSGGKWMGWTGSYWNLKNHEQSDLAMKKMFEFHDIVLSEYEREEVPERRKIRKAIVDRTGSGSKMHTIIDIAGNMLGIESAQLDSNPRRLNVRNGTIDLQTGELLPHRSEDFFTRVADVSYDATAVCPQWDKFMAAVQPDASVRQYLKRAFGYALTGLTTEHVLFYLYGNGANGKSTMVETVASLLRSADKVASSGYSLTIRPNVLAENSSGSSATPEIAQLRGTRVVVSSEPDHRYSLSPSTIKRLVGQDTISARDLYSPPVNFQPEFKLFLSANDKLSIPGADEGIWRRIRLIPFNVSFPADSKERDKELSAKFIPEFPGILRWLVEGSVEWFSSGLGTCRAVQEATAGYRSEMDYLGQFIEEHCEIDLSDSSATVQASLFLSAFNDWLRTSQSMMKPWTASVVRAALIKRGVATYRLGSKGPMYRFVKLVTTPESHYSRGA